MRSCTWVYRNRDHSGGRFTAIAARGRFSGKMRRIQVSSRDEFNQLSEDLFPSSFEGQPQSRLWSFHLPEIEGTVADVFVAPGVRLSRLRLRAHQNFTFSVRNTFASRIAKLAWIRSGRVSYDVHGARTLYGAYRGQTYLATFSGNTDTSVEMVAGDTIDSVSALLQAPTLARIYAGCVTGQSGGLLSHAAEPSHQPFRFTSVMTPEVDSLLSALTYSGTCSGGENAKVLSSLIGATLQLLDDHRRWSYRIIAPADVERVRRARVIMLDSLADPPSLVQLAHLVGLNEYKLKAGFRQAFGTTVGTELRRARLERARKLLLVSKASVADIALSVGYSNPGDFSALFKRGFGVTPSVYRREI